MTQVILQPAMEDAFISSGSPNTNYYSSPQLWVGLQGDDSAFRTLAKFDLSSVTGSVNIINAKLKLYVDQVTSPSAAADTTPYIITSAWSKSTVTWNTAPAFDEIITGNTVAITVTGWYEWDVTPIATAWFQAGYTNLGILVKSDELVLSSRKRMIRSTDTLPEHSTLRPMLTIEYEAVPTGDNSVLIGRNFVRQYMEVTSGGDYLCTLGYDTSQKSMVSFFAKNIGDYSAMVKLETSPNNTDYMLDGIETEVLPGEMIQLVPMIFANYTRLCYKSAPVLSPASRNGTGTSLELFYQAQV